MTIISLTIAAVMVLISFQEKYAACECNLQNNVL